MFSRTLLFRQILSGLKRFQTDRPCDIPHLSGLKRFLTDKRYNTGNLSVKCGGFPDILLDNLPQVVRKSLPY